MFEKIKFKATHFCLLYRVYKIAGKDENMKTGDVDEEPEL